MRGTGCARVLGFRAWTTAPRAGHPSGSTQALRAAPPNHLIRSPLPQALGVATCSSRSADSLAWIRGLALRAQRTSIAGTGSARCGFPIEPAESPGQTPLNLGADRRRRADEGDHAGMGCIQRVGKHGAVFDIFVNHQVAQPPQPDPVRRVVDPAVTFGGVEVVDERRPSLAEPAQQRRQQLVADRVLQAGESRHEGVHLVGECGIGAQSRCALGRHRRSEQAAVGVAEVRGLALDDTGEEKRPIAFSGSRGRHSRMPEDFAASCTVADFSLGARSSTSMCCSPSAASNAVPISAMSCAG